MPGTETGKNNINSTIFFLKTTNLILMLLQTQLILFVICTLTDLFFHKAFCINVVTCHGVKKILSAGAVNYALFLYHNDVIFQLEKMIHGHTNQYLTLIYLISNGFSEMCCRIKVVRYCVSSH